MDPDVDLDQDFQQVVNLASSLAKDPTLTTLQSKNLSTIIILIQEDHIQRRRHSDATRSRRKAARALLSAIYQHLGSAILFLCGVALPIAKLYRNNRRSDGFVSKLKSWSESGHITNGIVDLAEKNLTPSVLSHLGSDDVHTTQLKRGAQSNNMAAKRPKIQATTFEHGAIPSYHGVLDLAKRQQSSEAPTDGYDDGDNGEERDDGEGTEDSDESDSEAVQGTENLSGNPHSTPEDDVPLYSNVYELGGMDAIRVIANQEDLLARLTVPNLPNTTPFITIPCPRTFAMEYITKRNKIRW